VVVLTWNGEAVIEACLRLAVAECPAEIIMLDNGSRDHTLTRAMSPYIPFLDDDAHLEPGYLEVLVR